MTTIRRPSPVEDGAEHGNGFARDIGRTAVVDRVMVELAGQFLPPLDHPYRSKTGDQQMPEGVMSRLMGAPETAREQTDEWLTGFP